MKYSALARKVIRRRDHQGQVEAVGDGEVVTGQDHRAGVRNVFQPFDFRPAEQRQQRAHEDVLEQPIPHGPSRITDAPDGALRQLYPRSVDATTARLAPLTPRRSPGCADSGPGPAAAVRRAGGPSGGGAVGGGSAGGPASAMSSTHRADDRQQRDAVLGDDGQQRMLLAGHQRGQRAHRAPHLLALARARHRCPPPARRPAAPRDRAGPGWSAPAAAVPDRDRSADAWLMPATPPDSVEIARSAHCP